MREIDWTKVLVPKRPSFWVEFLLMQAGGYLVGVLAIITCEYRESWLTTAAIVGGCSAVVGFVSIWRRLSS